MSEVPQNPYRGSLSPAESGSRPPQNGRRLLFGTAALSLAVLLFLGVMGGVGEIVRDFHGTPAAFSFSGKSMAIAVESTIMLSLGLWLTRLGIREIRGAHSGFSQADASAKEMSESPNSD